MLTMLDCAHAGGRHRLACRISGPQEAPAVVCVHGLTRNARDFDALAKRLSADHRVVCIDMPGRGDSDWLEDPSLYCERTYLDDIRRVIDELRLPSIGWVGTSMGGLLGLRLASSEPGRVSALVLNDVGAELDGEELVRLRHAARAPVSFADFAEADRWFRERYAAFGRLSEARWRHLVETGVEPAPGARLRPRFDVRAVPDGAVPGRVDLWQAYRAVRCPVLVIRGALSRLLSRSTCEAMSACGPRAQHLEVAGAAHAPDLFDEGLVDAIAAFLAAPTGGNP